MYKSNPENRLSYLLYYFSITYFISLLVPRAFMVMLPYEQTRYFNKDVSTHVGLNILYRD